MQLCKDYKTLYFDGDILIADVTEDSPHINANTLIYSTDFDKYGYIPTGYIHKLTEVSDEIIPFGGRVDRKQQQALKLYVDYIKETSSSKFGYIPDSRGINIRQYTSDTEEPQVIAIPSRIESQVVHTISKGTFNDLHISRMIIPPTVTTIEPGSFSRCVIDELIFFDSLTNVVNESFDSCTVGKIHINATQEPAYQKTYFATFADKMDYLRQNRDKKKIVIICGSSARFGYNSPMLQEYFDDYKVINMGVYAYSNMMPIIYSIIPYLGKDDIVISSPEFDSIGKQFCTSSDFDNDTFCLFESDYALLSKLDMSHFNNIFDTYRTFNNTRHKMNRYSFSVTPNDYDESGNRTNGLSYNTNGDYIVYRPDNTDRVSFGVKRAYYNKEYFTEDTICSINDIYTKIRETGAKVYFAYSPRSNISISKDSNQNTIRELDSYLRANLCIPVITDIQESLMDPLYFYGTDNHLSTNGTKVYTKSIIDALSEVIAEQ